MSKYYRQHPITIVTGVFSELKSYIVPLFIFLILRSLGEESGTFFDRWFVIFILVTIGFSLIFGFLKWYFFRFSYQSESVEIHSGVFIKKHRSIKRNRIHTINLEANLIWQALNLVSLNIETPGNLGESEVKISAIPLSLATDLRETLNENNETNDIEHSANKKVKLDTLTLLKAGATSGSVGIVFAFIFALIGQLLAFIPERIFELLAQFFTQTDFVVIIILFVLGLIVSWLVSVVRYTLRYANFTLNEYDDYLEIHRGLFIKRHLTVKLSRIQAVTIVEGLIRQPFQLSTIELKVAGGASESTENVVIHPLIKSTKIPQFLSDLLPEYTLPDTYEKVPKRALRRYLFRASIPILLALGFIFINPFFIGVLTLLAIFSLTLGYLRYKDAGMSISENSLSLRSRRIAKTTALIPKSHIQSYEMITNPFQRFKKLKTLGVWVMASPSPASFKVKDLDHVQSQELYTWLSKTS